MYYLLIYLVVVALISPAVWTLDCPGVTMVTRKDWGSTVPRQNKKVPPFGRVFIHHSNYDYCTTETRCKADVLDTQKYHKRIFNEPDVNIHFFIGGDGRVYEGLGWNALGNHTTGYPNDLGIEFLGDFDTVQPTGGIMQALQNLLVCGVTKGKVQRYFSVYGHMDADCDTTCPGAKLYDQIKRLTHYGIGGQLANC